MRNCLSASPTPIESAKSSLSPQVPSEREINDILASVLPTNSSSETESKDLSAKVSSESKDLSTNENEVSTFVNEENVSLNNNVKLPVMSQISLRRFDLASPIKSSNDTLSKLRGLIYVKPSENDLDKADDFNPSIPSSSSSSSTTLLFPLVVVNDSCLGLQSYLFVVNCETPQTLAKTFRATR